MANNPYVNRVQKADGTTIIDISDTTATAEDVASGKYFYTAAGAKVQGTGGVQEFIPEETISSAEFVDAGVGWSYEGHEVGVIEIGATYKVVLNNIEYTVTGQYDIEDTPTIGDLDFSYAAYPFHISTYDYGNYYKWWLIIPSEPYTSQTIAAYKVGGGSPTGTISISTNGVHDVAAYASADVSVPTGTPRDSSDLSASGDTVTVPAGLYSSNATKSVASGTAGTPAATKGTVSNHSVTVTPSVTNTAGYISGGTVNGTPVTVTASELISFSTIRTGSGTPSSSLGVDGDIYIQTS